MTDRKIIASLLAERSKVAAAGLTDRVAELDLRLRVLGYRKIETASIEPQVETATRKKSLKRKKG